LNGNTKFNRLLAETRLIGITGVGHRRQLRSGLSTTETTPVPLVGDGLAGTSGQHVIIDNFIAFMFNLSSIPNFRPIGWELEML
jgi:hypothetical protein